MFTDYIKSEIRNHALKTPDKEVCGYISYNNGYKIFRAINESENPSNHFIISPKTYLKASAYGSIVASYHSQKSIDFSELDKINCNGHSLPMILYSIDTDSFNFLRNSEDLNPYIGRSFELGKNDCFSLIRDYYRDLGITINDYPRPNNWINEPGPEYEDNYLKEGFVDSGELRLHDILLFKTHTQKYPYHAAVYQGNNLILHHEYSQFSRVCEYSNIYKRITYRKLRHKDLL